MGISLASVRYCPKLAHTALRRLRVLRMKRHSLLIKPASSLCNMRCEYCFYSGISAVRDTPSYGIMPLEVVEKLIGNIFRDINEEDEITIAFQGGEPSLAGLSWFKHFIEYAAPRKKGVAVNYAFQTNGLLLDESWCEFFHEYNFLLGLSIDAGKRLHNRNRLSASGEGTYEACLRSKELMEKNHVEYNVLCVLTNDLAKEPDKAWRFIQNEKIRYMQFIPCLEAPSEDFGAGRPDGNALRPARFAAFYSRLLYWWIKELENGNYISVKLFDDVVNYFCKGIPTSCGINGQCRHQYVVEADGSVYPCDFYAFDKYKIGNLAESSLREMFDTQKVRDFLLEKPELPVICNSCGFFNTCRGGCKRMRHVMYIGAGGLICGFRTFLEKCLGPLEYAVRRVFANQHTMDNVKAGI